MIKRTKLLFSKSLLAKNLMISFRTLFLLTAGIVQFPTVQANDLLFESDDPQKIPFSVPLSEIEARINNDPSADGVKLSIRTEGTIMRVDVIAIPGDTSIAAVTRVVMMIGRLAEQEYSEMRFTDEGEDLYIISGETIRNIGGQFVWGEEGKGQNPIHLIRLFADGLRTPDGQRVAPRFTGSLLGDTGKAVNTMNEHFNKNWVLRTVEIL